MENEKEDVSLLLKDDAYQKLLGMIFANKITYGYIYSLNDIAEKLGMSRTPVRDAVQRLADENRVDMLPSRGFRLHRISRDELLQMYHFSNAIEGYCVIVMAQKCAQGCPPPEFARLRELTDALEQVVERGGSFEEHFAIDDRFHRTLMESANDACFVRLTNANLGFIGHPELQMVSEIPERKIMRDIYNFHRSIMDAIAQGDELGAHKALMAHADYMYEIYSQNPDESFESGGDGFHRSSC